MSRFDPASGPSQQEKATMNNTISKEAVLGILSDFDWHHRREFIPLARHISPEIACRAYLRSTSHRSAAPSPQNYLEIRIRQGRARIIDEYIRRLKENEYIEVSGRGAEKRVRLVRRVYVDHRGKLAADLMRCPCCDGKPILTDVFNFEARQFRAECDNCHLCLDGGDKQSVVEAWNRRAGTTVSRQTTDDATTEPSQELIEDLTRQCSELQAALAVAHTERDEALAAIQQFAPIIVR
jgi:hypothetical protein